MTNSKAVGFRKRGEVLGVGLRFVDLRQLQTTPLPGIPDKGDGIPSGAMLYEDGSPMLFEDGAFMLYEG